jgi:hypothetical protein
MKSKKADITWETIAKLLLALAFLVFMTMIVYLYKDKLLAMLNSLVSMMRFR